MTTYRASSKVSYFKRKLFSLLFSVERCHDLNTSHCITASVRPSREALLKADVYAGTYTQVMVIQLQQLDRHDNRLSWRRLQLLQLRTPSMTIEVVRGPMIMMLVLLMMMMNVNNSCLAAFPSLKAGVIDNGPIEFLHEFLNILQHTISPEERYPM